jgi:hypothetical protein
MIGPFLQNYKFYFGLHPSSGIYKTKNHNVSETGSVSILRWMGQERPVQLGPLGRASPNHCTTGPVVPQFQKLKLKYCSVFGYSTGRISSLCQDVASLYCASLVHLCTLQLSLVIATCNIT